MNETCERISVHRGGEFRFSRVNCATIYTSTYSDFTAEKKLYGFMVALTFVMSNLIDLE